MGRKHEKTTGRGSGPGEHGGSGGSSQRPSRSALQPAGWRATSPILRSLTRLRTFGGPRAGLLVTLVALVVLLLVGLWTGRAVDRALTDSYTQQLQTILDADVAALELWIGSQQKLAASAAADERVVAAVAGLHAIAGTADDAEAPAVLASAPEQATLAALLDPLLGEGIFGFAVFDNAGRVLAFHPERDHVGRRLTGAGQALLAEPRQGRPAVIRPVLSEAIVEGEAAPPKSASADAARIVRAISVATPVRDGDRVGAVLLLRMRPAHDFSRILSVARLGRSGETYAFNQQGFMISESRFEGELRAIGVLPAEDADADTTFTIQLRDPGGDLLRGHVPGLPIAARPFTRMAASAIAGDDGVDVDGYRDYRGVEVIGAWRWLGQHGFGVATEVDREEAFSALAPLRLALWLLFAALVVVTIMVASSTIAIGQLGRRIAEVQQLGQYTLERKIGEGGMGSVYLAKHAMLSRPTALKLLRKEVVSPENVARFEREVQLTSQLAHPNIIEIYDYGRSPDGVFYFAMEYLPGMTLTALVKRDGAVPPPRTIHILRQVCASLEEAHAAGLVHRDIKPLNIMLCHRGTQADLVKVLDFGLVKDVSTPEELQVTSPGMVGGTPPYIAPERLKDPSVVDPRSDLFSVGVVAFNLVTGKDLWEGLSALDICSKVLHDEPPKPSDVTAQAIPGPLEQLILALLAKKPEDRPQSAADVIGMLDAIESGQWSRHDARAWWAAYEAARSPAS